MTSNDYNAKFDQRKQYLLNSCVEPSQFNSGEYAIARAECHLFAIGKLPYNDDTFFEAVKEVESYLNRALTFGENGWLESIIEECGG